MEKYLDMVNNFIVVKTLKFKKNYSIKLRYIPMIVYNHFTFSQVNGISKKFVIPHISQLGSSSCSHD